MLKRRLEPGQLVTFDDLELQPSRVLDIVLQQRQKVLEVPATLRLASDAVR